MRRTEFSARAGRPTCAAVFCLLVALLLVTALAGCGNARSRGSGADGPGRGGVAASSPGAGELKPPVIHGIKLDPPSREVGGWYAVAGTVTFTADVTGADRVEFQLSPTGTGAPVVLSHVDEDGRDGWTFVWEVPPGDLSVHLTVIASNRAGTAQTVINLYHEEPEKGGAGGVVPLEVSPRGLARFAVRELRNLPEYFLAKNWLDEDRIFGLAGTRPVVVNAQDGSHRALNVVAWWASPSPDGRFLAYGNEKGISVIGTDGKGDRLLVKARGNTDPVNTGASVLGGVLWSPDSARLLFWEGHEWDSDFYVLDVAGGGVSPVPAHLEGYFLTSPIGWVSSDVVVFNARASRRKDGSGEYSLGYRSDILLVSLSGGRRLLTDARDGEFWQALEPLPDGRLLCAWGTKENWPAGFGLIDPEGRVTRLETGPGTRQVRMAPGADRWLEVRDAVQGQTDNVCEIFLARAGGAQKLATVTFGDSFEPPAWSPSGKQVVLSFASRFPADASGAFRSRYFTYVLEEKGGE
ncbi:MAG: TolB family protein [Desulfotomaculales bacterium]